MIITNWFFPSDVSTQSDFMVFKNCNLAWELNRNISTHNMLYTKTKSAD